MSRPVASCPRFVPLATAFLLLAVPAAATTPADLCTGNPCVVSGAHAVDAGSVLDFGPAVELRFAPSAVVTIRAGVPRTLSLSAGAIVLQPGAAIVGGELAVVSLDATAGELRLERSGATAARIDVSANQAGSVTLTASAGVVLAGSVEARGSGRDAQGGTITVSSGAQTLVTGSLLASATGNGSAGGSIELAAEGSIAVDGTLSAAGNDFGGGTIVVAARGGALDLAGSVDVRGGAPDGSAGSVELAATGSITSTATLTGTGGSGAQEACGDGASVTIVADLDVGLGGGIDLTGGTHCVGGELLVEAGRDFRQLNGATFTARGPGAYGSGGTLGIGAGGAIVLRSADLGSPGAGGTIEAVAAGELAVRGPLGASATGGDGIGGSILLQACQLNVAAAGSLDTRGPVAFPPFGVNHLRASGAMTIAGTMRAALANRLVHAGPVPAVTGTVAPAATVVLDPALPACPAVAECGNGALDAGETCDDGNRADCDGCSADCMRVDAQCGDGARECGEQCDDGNVVDGDGCEASCTRTPPEGVRLRGVPLETSGCIAQWALDVPSPALDADTGLPAKEQRCTDGDPACDRDASVDGVCSFDLQVCLGVPDPALPACTPRAVKLVDLIRPKADAPSSDDVDRDNAAALAAAVRALGVKTKAGGQVLQQGAPVRAPDSCTQAFRVHVPHGPGVAAERTFRIAARAQGAVNMQRNPLVLACDPAPTVCGDGVLQAGESCDDGNADACDGCSTTCAAESCGNGVVECGEECDLGPDNGTPDASCDAACGLRTPELRIPGEGARRYGCAHEWSVRVADADVPRDREGLPKQSIRCVDGDPSCDGDPTAGTCRIRVWSCLGGADLRLACAAEQVGRFTARAPSRNATRAAEKAARAALNVGIASLTLPVGPGERCTAPMDIDVPVRDAYLELKVDARLAKRRGSDRDTLRLKCARP